MSRLNSQRTVTLSDDARDVLVRSCTEGSVLRLPEGALSRPLYDEIAGALERINGRWSRANKAHVFPGDARDAIDLLLGGDKLPPKNPYDYFATPDAVADRMVQLAAIDWFKRPYPMILEPSAGEGHIVRAIVNENPNASYVLQMVEIDPVKVAVLEKLKLGFVIKADFLTWVHPEHESVGPVLYDRIVMNPPFTSVEDPQAYMAHIEKAISLLAPAGRLVSIVPSGYIDGSTKRHIEFRALIRQYRGKCEDVPAEAFKESGTAVRTYIITVEKD